MGNGNFRPPTKSTPFNRSPKNVRGDYDGNPYSYVKFGAHPPMGASGRMGEILRYFLFISLPVFGNSPRRQTRRRIFAHDGSNDADSRRMCRFGFRWYCSPFRGYNPPKLKSWGMNRRFQAKLAKLKNMHIIKTTGSIHPNFAQW